MLLQKKSIKTQTIYFDKYKLKLTFYVCKKNLHTIIDACAHSSALTNNFCSSIIQSKRSKNFGKVCNRFGTEKIDGVYYCGLHKKKFLNKSITTPFEKFQSLAERYKLFGIIHEFNYVSKRMETRKIKNDSFFHLIEKNNNFKKGLLQKFYRFYLQSEHPRYQLYIVMVNLLKLNLLNNISELKKKLADFLGFKQTPLISLNHNNFLNKKSTSIYM